MNTPSKSITSLLSRVAPLALLRLSSANLYAQQAMSISLNGAAEVPPVATSATGSGQITVFTDHRVSGRIKTSGFVPTMAHIHEGAVGKNGPPIITLTQTANDSFVVPAGARLTDAQYTSFTAGELYVNVHSAQYPNGEIRAQLLRTETDGTPTRADY
ncbi:CHRD domain-containing protein [Thiobacillus denitrificans]|uniref:CHRD domain-containing protein n=1 Tax=Thiobacillus denitrificans TaxID=36861 RepID=A0A106BQU4_THIDE|nr:CHRD domain-containing protein [Thiobacillus denitrificans]KVW96951.1 CHRD domain-containing protein [Thiobacillus denitrificans]